LNQESTYPQPAHTTLTWWPDIRFNLPISPDPYGGGFERFFHRRRYNNQVPLWHQIHWSGPNNYIYEQSADVCVKGSPIESAGMRPFTVMTLPFHVSGTQSALKVKVKTAKIVKVLFIESGVCRNMQYNYNRH
jgi:hypothetical protein